MRFKTDSKHNISPELRAQRLAMSGKVNAGNAAALAASVDIRKLLPGNKPKKAKK